MIDLTVKIENFVHKNIINNCKTHEIGYINLAPMFSCWKSLIRQKNAMKGTNIIFKNNYYFQKKIEQGEIVYWCQLKLK